mgnify:CR=1 FL=1
MVDVREGQPVAALGLMCGTSMDGVDAAILETDGETIASRGPSLEIAPAYSAGQRTVLREVSAALAQGREGPLAEAARAVEDIHFAALTALRARAERDPAVVGFHGQTLFHDPERARTVQAGDGARLAALARLPVVWDFRSEDMAGGGEGAPLAPVYHWALARHLGLGEPVAFLNIGGVANVTWVDPRAEVPEAKGALLAFDTGPGNALLNDWMTARTGAPMDEGGAAASAGRVHRDRLSSNAAAAYLARQAPKSLDRDAFRGVLAAMEGLTVEDGAASLAAFTVDCVAAARRAMPRLPARWLVTGGGRRNAAMMAGLAATLGGPVEPVEEAGLDGDMLEAEAFAFLAVRVIRGLPTSFPTTTGCRAPVSGGRVSLP